MMTSRFENKFVPYDQIAQLKLSDYMTRDDSSTDEPQEQTESEKIPLNPKAPMGDLHALAKMLYEQLSDTDAVIKIYD